MASGKLRCPLIRDAFPFLLASHVSTKRNTSTPYCLDIATGGFERFLSACRDRDV